jgi:hypothetical protein
MSTSTPVRLGAAGLKGWREKVADTVSEPAARVTPLQAEHARAAIGAAFLVLSVVYVAQALADVVRVLRDR